MVHNVKFSHIYHS